MKAQTGPMGNFANGTAERKIAVEITTTLTASRRSLRSAGRGARNAGLSPPDPDSRYRSFCTLFNPPWHVLSGNTAAWRPCRGSAMNHTFDSHRGRGCHGQSDTADADLRPPTNEKARSDARLAGR